MICYYCMCPMVEVEEGDEKREYIENMLHDAPNDDIDVLVFQCPECERVEIAYEA
jgi:hypothetical protein